MAAAGKKAIAMTDELVQTIANYAAAPPSFSEEAYQTAALCLADALGCAILALQYPACRKLLGPIVPEIAVAHGCRIPGTNDTLDPINGAFNLGTMIRWLDFNDTWLAAEWGHPSDNIGGLLTLADYLSQLRISQDKQPLLMNEVLTRIIQAYEIQGGLAILNSFNKVGFDHVVYVKLATAAIAAKMLGGSSSEIADAVSQSWIDAGPLRTYRHAPNVGSRKSWAAGDATSRGVWLALMTMRGEKGYATPLSAPKWGLYDVLFEGAPFSLQRPLGDYVMKNILFKIAFPAEFHAQTAVEAAIHLFPKVKDKLAEIEKIIIHTHDSAIRIIDKKGPLNNPADRDHCLQYMVAVALLKGSLTADDYEDAFAQQPMIDVLRSKTEVNEHSSYSRDYHDPDKRSIANAVKIIFKDGTATEEIAVEYPLGHRRRRQEGIPLLFDKLRANLQTHYQPEVVNKQIALFEDISLLKTMPVNIFMDNWTKL
jgi:2-methylcitrate dehydratase